MAGPSASLHRTTTMRPLKRGRVPSGSHQRHHSSYISLPRLPPSTSCQSCGAAVASSNLGRCQACGWAGNTPDRSRAAPCRPMAAAGTGGRLPAGDRRATDRAAPAIPSRDSRRRRSAAGRRLGSGFRRARSGAWAGCPGAGVRWVLVGGRPGHRPSHPAAAEAPQVMAKSVLRAGTVSAEEVGARQLKLRLATAWVRGGGEVDRTSELLAETDWTGSPGSSKPAAGPWRSSEPASKRSTTPSSAVRPGSVAQVARLRPRLAAAWPSARNNGPAAGGHVTKEGMLGRPEGCLGALVDARATFEVDRFRQSPLCCGQ